MNYTSFGGTYMIQTGANIGSEVFGQDPLWLAWVTDLINFKNQGGRRHCAGGCHTDPAALRPVRLIADGQSV